MEGYKIALICDWYLPRIGGIELHLRDLAKELRLRGHEAHIITSTKARCEEDDGVVVHRINTPLLPGWEVIFRPKVIGILKDLLKRERYDVIHSHSIYSPLAVTAISISNNLGLPSVLSNHSLLRESKIQGLLAKGVFGIWANKATVITAVSGAAKKDVEDAAGRQDVLVLPNGINVGKHLNRRTENEKIKILSVMRLTKRKSPSRLIRAMPMILKHCSDNAHLTIVGDGPERNKLENETRSLNLCNNVKFEGTLPRDEILRRMTDYDMFVMPSSIEAFGIALLEARDRGLPVVGMNHGGAGDVIEHGKHGFLANSDEEFSKYIIKMLSEPDLRLKLSGNTKHGLEKFDWENIASRHIEIYRLAIEKLSLRGTKNGLSLRGTK